MRSYAIGDIHGHLDQLRRVHALIEADRLAVGDKDAPIVHIGDLVDRGPDCRGVVEFLHQGVEQGQNWIVLLGNHDYMFTLFLDDWKAHDPGLRPDLSWLHPRLGGAVTLESYGVENAADRPIAPVHAEAIAAVPAAHRRFLEERPLWYQRGEVIFVHAGIRPGVPMDQQTRQDLTWIRGAFLNDTRDHGGLIVHGHTAIDAPTHYGNRLNIDSSAAYGGPLSAVVIEGRSVYRLTDVGRVPLLPLPQ